MEEGENVKRKPWGNRGDLIYKRGRAGVLDFPNEGQQHKVAVGSFPNKSPANEVVTKIEREIIAGGRARGPSCAEPTAGEGGEATVRVGCNEETPLAFSREQEPEHPDLRGRGAGAPANNAGARVPCAGGS